MLEYKKTNLNNLASDIEKTYPLTQSQKLCLSEVLSSSASSNNLAVLDNNIFNNNIINCNTPYENDYSYYIESLLNKWFDNVSFEDETLGTSCDGLKENSSSCKSTEISESYETNTSSISIRSDYNNSGNYITNQKSMLVGHSKSIDFNNSSITYNNNHEQPKITNSSNHIPKNQYCMINPYNTNTIASLSSPSKMLKDKLILKDLDVDLFEPAFFDLVSNIQESGLANANYINELISEIWHKKDRLLSFNKKKHIYEPLEIIYSIQIETDLPKRLLENIVEYHKNDKMNVSYFNLDQEILYINKIYIRLKESPTKLTRIDEKDLRELYDKIIKLLNIKQYSEKMKKNLNVTKLFLENNIKLFNTYNISHHYNNPHILSNPCQEQSHYQIPHKNNFPHNGINTPKDKLNLSGKIIHRFVSNNNKHNLLNHSNSSSFSNSGNNSDNYSTGNASYLEDVASNKISLDFITVNKLLEKLTKISPNEFSSSSKNPFENQQFIKNTVSISSTTTSRLQTQITMSNSYYEGMGELTNNNNKSSFITNLTPVVIYTYDEYTNAINLLMYLIVKYNMPKPFGMSHKENEKFENSVVKLIKLKIMAIIKFWICERQEDFVLNDTLCELLIIFLDRIIYFEKDKHIKQVSKYLWEKWQKIKEYKSKPKTLKNLVKLDELKQEYKNESQFGITKALCSPINSTSNTHVNKSISNSNMRNGIKISKFHHSNTFQFSFHQKSSSLIEFSHKINQTPNISMKPYSVISFEDEIILKHEIEAAKQLTLLEFKLFSKITIYELLRLRYNKSMPNDNQNLINDQMEANPISIKYSDPNNNNNPHIPNNLLGSSSSSSFHQYITTYDYTNYKKFVSRTNNTMIWIEYLILKQFDLNKKLEYIKKFLIIAKYCLSINNFSTCHTIVAALFRLKPYIKWKQDLENSLQELHQCFGLNDKVNYYTKLFHDLKSPCLPLLWIYSSLFQRYHESKIYKNIKGYSKKYILFTTIIKMSELCSDFKKLQQYKYTYEKNEEIYNFLKNCCNMSNQKYIEEQVKKLKETYIMIDKEKNLINKN